MIKAYAVSLYASRINVSGGDLSFEVQHTVEVIEAETKKKAFGLAKMRATILWPPSLGWQAHNTKVIRIWMRREANNDR
jgi:hypothetical protein